MSLQRMVVFSQSEQLILPRGLRWSERVLRCWCLMSLPMPTCLELCISPLVFISSFLLYIFFSIEGVGCVWGATWTWIAIN